MKEWQIKRNGVDILISDQIYIKTKKMLLETWRIFYNECIKKNVKIINIYASKNESPKYMKQKLNKEMHNSVITVEPSIFHSQ